MLARLRIALVAILAISLQSYFSLCLINPAAEAFGNNDIALTHLIFLRLQIEVPWRWFSSSLV